MQVGWSLSRRQPPHECSSQCQRADMGRSTGERWTGGCTGAWTGEWTGGWTGEWTGEWTGAWTGGWTGEWVCGTRLGACIKTSLHRAVPARARAYSPLTYLPCPYTRMPTAYPEWQRLIHEVPAEVVCKVVAILLQQVVCAPAVFQAHRLHQLQHLSGRPVVGGEGGSTGQDVQWLR
eukprot:352450-Chlamydomonas_euryale.AAC.5